MEKRIQQTLILVATIGVLSLVGAAQPCKAASSSAANEMDPIQFFSNLREANTNHLFAIDQAIDKKLIQADSPDSVSASDIEVQKLQSEKSEYQYRQDFLNRMILKFDTKFRGGDVQSFLGVTLKEMAQVAAKSDDSTKVLWKFLNYMSVSISSLPKGHADILKFVEGYMNMGSIKDPIEPSQFLSQLDYYNGTQVQKANDMTPAQAVELMESSSVSNPTPSL